MFLFRSIRQALKTTAFLIFGIFTLASTAMCGSLPKLNDVPVIEKTFENGLTCVVQEYPGSGLAALNIAFKTGSAAEGELCGYGISHLIEHLMIRSSRRYPQEGTIEKILKTLGGTFNASTSADTVSVYITVPKDNLLQALDLIQEMVFFPNFSDEHVIKEKDVVFKEIILYNDNPDAKVNELLWKTAFRIHPYQHPVIGYPLLFKAITPKDVRHSYATRFTPSSAVLAVAGDVKAVDVFTAIEKKIPDMSLPFYTPIHIPEEPPQTMPRSSKETFDADMGRLAIGFHSPGILNPDIFALDLIAVILGQGDASRLNKKLVKELQLVQSISVGNDTLLNHGVFTITAVLSPERLGEIKHLIFKEITALQQKPISSLELKRAKTLLISSYIASHASLDAIAGSLSLEKLLTGDAQFSQKYIDAVDKVTVHEIQRIAKKYLTPESANHSLLVPKTFHADDAKQTTDVRTQSLPWKSKTLKNGIKLIAIQNTLIPMLSTTILFQGGLLAETPQTNGLSKICAQMLVHSKINNEDLSSLFENRGAHISAFSDDNSFGLGATALKSDLSFTLKTIATILEDPIFPDDELSKLKKICLLDIQAENDNMFAHGFTKFKAAIYKNHPYGLRANGTKESISALTRKDLIDFYKRLGVSTNMVVAVCGDINPTEAITTMEKIFSKFHASTLKPPITAQGITPLQTQEKITINIDRQGAMVFFGFHGIRLDDHAVFAFDILSSIMSGHNGRLLYTIRNQNNLTYIQNFFSSPSYDTGFFGIYAGTSVEKQDELIKGIEEQLSLLSKDGVTDKEIADSKAELITRNLIRKQRNDVLAHRAAQYLLYGLDLSRLFNYENDIANVTKNDINAIIHHYISSKPYLRLLITSAAPTQ